MFVCVCLFVLFCFVCCCRCVFLFANAPRPSAPSFSHPRPVPNPPITAATLNLLDIARSHSARPRSPSRWQRPVRPGLHPRLCRLPRARHDEQGVHDAGDRRRAAVAGRARADVLHRQGGAHDADGGAAGALSASKERKGHHWLSGCPCLCPGRPFSRSLSLGICIFY